MTTIQDVARLAHVSVSSVSNALNGKADRMRPDTYARIQDAIRKLGYRPNQAARQLKTGHIPILGLLVPTTANPFFGQLAMAMETYAQQRHGYRVLLCNTHRDKKQEAAMFDDLIAFGVAAVIVVSSLSDEQHIEAAIARGLAVISFDLALDPDSPARHDYVLPDNVMAGMLAARHLIEQGHKRLAFAMPKGLTFSRRQKIEGFMAAIDQAGAGVSGRIVEGKSTTQFGDTELAGLGYELSASIAELDPRPTGVVTVNDMMAVGLMAGIRNQGLSIPQDISIVGMDDLTLSAYMWPPLTSVRMPVAEMGLLMVDRAIQRIEEPDLKAEQFCFTPTLTIRQSVSAPPSSHKKRHSRNTG
ncbi:MAG: LacI family DNA-binding transcriptional regulator [Pusillimonas sp.]